MARAGGRAPAIVAIEVMRIGRSRIGQASSSASWRSTPRRPDLVREVDEHDRVLLGDPHEEDHPEHAVDVQALAAEPEREERAADAERQGEEHREGVGERVELRGEHHVGDDEAEHEREPERLERLAERLGAAGGDRPVAVGQDLAGRSPASGRRRSSCEAPGATFAKIVMARSRSRRVIVCSVGRWSIRTMSPRRTSPPCPVRTSSRCDVLRPLPLRGEEAHRGCRSAAPCP